MAWQVVLTKDGERSIIKDEMNQHDAELMAERLDIASTRPDARYIAEDEHTAVIGASVICQACLVSLRGDHRKDEPCPVCGVKP